jgi:hypothetical protein
MFDTRKTITNRTADTIDLLIDFATLGEYGLEPPVAPAPPPCEGRRRSASPRSTGSWGAAVNRFAAQS